MSETTIERVQDPTTVDSPSEPGDHDKLSHYVTKDAYMEALVSGKPTRALCGKMWVPTRDGEKFPVCPECKEVYEGLPA